MHERFLKGFVAGAFSGLAMNVWSFFAGIVQLSTFRMADWGAAIIFGHAPPYSGSEVFIGFIGQVAFSGFLGIVFAYLVPLISSVWLVIKAIIYSNGVWFAANAITSLFQMPGTIGHPPKTVIGNYIASTIFGYVLAKSWYVMADASSHSVTQSSPLAAPAMKPVSNATKEPNSDEANKGDK